MSGCGVRPSTVQELLRARARAGGGRGYVYLADGERQEQRLSFAELDARAGAIGGELRRRGLEGARALLLYPPGLDYLCGFFGSLYAPAVPVPIYPPDPARLERSVRRLVAVIEDARPAAALTTAAVCAAIQPLLGLAPALAGLEWIATDRIAGGGDDSLPDVDPDGAAFLQYTSGSTGAPRGVVLTHRNLIHNSARIREAFGYAPGSRGVIWLPPYHDMGLIGGILQPLYGDIDVVLMSPLDFLARPMRWLEAISRARAAISGGPNFAFDLCVRKSSPQERAQLDLSSWEVAFNGAEPVRAETLERFAEAFGPAGFRRAALFPCYGLAETTLIATGGPRLSPARVVRMAREELARGRAVEHGPGLVDGEAMPAGNEVTLVGCGRAFDDGELAIVDPASGRRCSVGEVGEIWLAGDSVARGYFGRPEETERVFGAMTADGGGPFLRTGDLGFVLRGELFVAGRLADLIIVRGRNHHAADLERTAERASASLRPGCSAAFQVAVDDPRVVLIAEIARREGGDLDEVCRSLRQAVAEEHELQLDAVVLVRAGTVPKTSSGKIERHGCRRAFADGGLVELARSELGGLDAGQTALPVSSNREDAYPTGADVLAVSGGQVLRRYLVGRVARLARVRPADVAADLPVTALGLDSLAALELQAMLESELGARVPAVELLRGATLEQIASRIEPQLGRLPTSLTDGGDAVEYPLSVGQRALWFLQLLAPESAAYNVWVAARIAGAADADALRAACQRLLDRHASLRAAVFLRDGVPWQRVEPRAVDFEVIDAEALDEPGLSDALAAEAHRPFDLAAGVFRARLYRRRGGGALLLAAHHMAVDLWSAGLLLSELTGRGAPGGRSFADHVAAQATWLAGGEGSAAWSAWQETLSGHLPALALPLDRPRPRRQSFRGAARATALDAATARRVRDLARREGTTAYAVLLSAFAAFLHRLSGQDDLIIGSPTAGRDPGFERAVGYFVNPVPIRADLSGAPSFRQLLGRTRGAVLRAIEHASLPMATMVERMPGARSLDRAPLFQALFALERAHTNPELTPFLTGGGGRVEVAGAALEPLSIEHRASAFDVALVLVDDGAPAQGNTGHKAGVHGSWRYDTELFTGETAERWSRQFQVLLAALLADPDRAIDDAPMAAEEEARRCLGWNPVAPEAGGELLFHRLVEEQVRRRADAPAVVMGGVALSYRELDARADHLAARLRRLGVAPERPVGVLLERSVDQAVAALGVLKAGGVYLPLDPGLPDERLRFVLEDAGAAAAVTVRALAGRAGLPAVLLDGDDGDHDRLPCPAAPRIHPDGAAYIIYTSGSTGPPKGVVVSHRSACNLAEAQRRTFAVTPDCRVLQYASCAFDASFFELSLALTAGAALHVVPARCLLPGPDLVRLLRDGAITTVTLPPGVLAALRADQLPGIHTVISAGEACPAELVARWGQEGRRFFNAYGPTEATVWSTVAELGGTRDHHLARPPIGAPVHGVRAYVLDRALRPAPVGAVGELFVGGASVARGYAGRPDLTAGRFVPDPFGPPGARLYRTGDLARWLDDGSIDFLGRADDQVKIRGFRVEPGEVESALGAHPDLRDAAVVARADRRGEVRLVAYMAGEQAPPLDELRAFLRRHGLPDYLLPAAAVLLPALPRTPSGKVDRRALPEPAEPVRSAPFAAPSNELEHLLLGVFREVLGHEQIGAHDHFFEVLGGNSLAVVRACALLSERAHLEVEVTAIFEHPTIHLLAAHLGERCARARRGEDGGRGELAGRAEGVSSHQERAGARAAALRRRGRG